MSNRASSRRQLSQQNVSQILLEMGESEFLMQALIAGLAQPPAHVRIQQQIDQSMSELRRITVFNQPASHTILDGVDEARHAERHNRELHGRGLERDVRTPLTVARQTKNIHGRVEWGRIPVETDNPDAWIGG